MPAVLASPVAAPTPAKTPSAKRFELPVLDFKFASLTDGTDIPPPLPSPVKEVPTPPETPKAAATANGNGGGAGAKAAANGGAVVTGTKRPADDTPLSPALSSRQGSIRRLFSRNLLNGAYADAEGANGAGGLQPPATANGASSAARPASRTGSYMDDKKAKRSSGWFRRLRGGDAASKRSSQLYEEATKQPTGPPPPMIPELGDMEGSHTLGNDLFKDIK